MDLLTFRVVLFILFFSLFANKAALAESPELFDEALMLLKENYYNKNKVLKVLSEQNIIECDGKRTKSEYGGVTCLVKKFNDPYTKFLTPKESKSELKKIRTINLGVGIVLDPIDKGRVLKVLPKSPSDLAKIKAGDYIQSINGTPIELLNDKEIEGQINNLKALTKIELEMKRDYLNYSVSLTPKELVGVATRSKMLKGGILYIRIDDLLSKGAASELAKELASPVATKSNGLILDLRDNKGGLLKNAIAISDLFLGSGVILSIESSKGKMLIKANKEAVYVKPMAVLINSSSASASEIIASSLKDNSRAKLVGMKSYGKGLVQKISVLSNGGALHITVDKFYTPKGHEINKIGILPDVWVFDEGKQISAALELLSN